MLLIKSLRNFSIFLLGLSASGLSASGLIGLIAPLPVHALPTAPIQISLDFKVPDRGVAGTTAGGGTRGQCLSGPKKLVPLIPKTNLGLTVSDRPSFFAYIPPVSGVATETPQTAEFLLLGNDDRDVVYQANFALPSQPGIVQYDLPEDAPALKLGNRYHWYITLPCDTAAVPKKNISVEGWVERTALSPSLTKALKSSEPSRRSTLYAEAGIWHETLTSLAALYRQNPRNQSVMADWSSVLKSVGLESVANEPIARACP